jgi:D-amino-acid oxidase
MARARILVIGAGVSGLTSARLLLEEGHEVTLRSREDPLETTSAVAGALWYPFEAGPPERVDRWARRAYARFRELAARATPGVRMESLLDLRSPAIAPPGWVRALEGFRLLEDLQEEAGAAPPFEQGWSARVPVIETGLYLPWLLAEVRARGGRLERGALASLAAERGFDLIVNCSGLGARELCADGECFPIRGQIVRVARGAVDRALVFQQADHSFGYVIPRAHDCVLGGTAERGVSSLAPDPRATEAILARCRGLEPRIAGRVQSVAVGLRPGRSSIRLEAERLADGRIVVHDYGHGGCGVTLSWACAEDVVHLVRGALA